MSLYSRYTCCCQTYSKARWLHTTCNAYILRTVQIKLSCQPSLTYLHLLTFRAETKHVTTVNIVYSLYIQVLCWSYSIWWPAHYWRSDTGLKQLCGYENMSLDISYVQRCNIHDQILFASEVIVWGMWKGRRRKKLQLPEVVCSSALLLPVSRHCIYNSTLHRHRR